MFYYNGKPENSDCLQWYVLIDDFNKREFCLYNVLNDYFVGGEVFKALKKHKDSKEDFAKQVESEVKYRYWSRSEWELVLSPWCSNAKEVKIDVYDQLWMNWDIFIDYLWNNQALIRKAHRMINRKEN